MSIIAVPKLRDVKCVLILFPKILFKRDLNVIHECFYIQLRQGLHALFINFLLIY